VFGPVLFLFYAWLVRHPALVQLQRLHFLSREGHVLVRLHEQVRQRFPALQLPEGKYFYASRRVALCAAQAVAFAPEQIIAGAGFTGSMREFLWHRLGLDYDGPVQVEWQIELPRDSKKLCAELEELKPYITRFAAQEREKFVRYAQQMGMLEDGRQGVVDIGYSATIQKALQTALGLPLTGFYLASFDAAASVADNGGQAYGCVAENIRPFTSDAPVLKNPFLMEAFLTAPHGQLTGFSPDLQPVFKPASLTPQEADTLADLHQGALDCCLALLEVYGPDLLHAEMGTALPQEFFRMAMEGQLILPDEVAAMLRVEDDFCGNGQMQVGLGAV
jgi:hypothetical protein